MPNSSKYKLSSHAIREINDACDVLEQLWKEFKKMKSPPNFRNLVVEFETESSDDISNIRFELTRELIETDCEFRKANGIPASREVYSQMLLLEEESVLDLLDWDKLHVNENEALNADYNFQVESGASPRSIDETRDMASLETSATSERNIPARNNSWAFLDAPIQPGDLGCLGQDYRILEKLGSGGMGTVFLAEDTKLLRKVAIKIIHQANEQTTSESQQRFLREARAMAAIESEHVVTVYQVGHHNGIVFLVMPVLRGETLGSRLNHEGALTQPESLRIAKEIAVGLSQAHELGQVHRDIKPENVWLEKPNAKVKLLDFGLVRTASDTFKTIDGAILGTPRYMSPEQIKGKEVEQASDLFSLGAVLYQMLSGRPPFGGDSLHATLLAVSSCQFESLSEQQLPISPEVSTFVDKLLSANPEDRPQPADEVVDKLEALALTKPPNPISQPEEISKEQPQTMGVSGRSSLPRFLIGAAFFATLILLSILVLKFRGQDGTVIVELDGDVEIAQIEIDGNKVNFDRKGEHVEFEVDSGTHRLAITTPAGNVLRTNLTDEKITVYSGKNNDKIRAWVESSEKPDSVSMPEDKSKDLDAMTPQERELNGLKWILKHKRAFASVSLSGGRSLDVKNLSEIPNEAFKIHSVVLRHRNFDNGELRNLSGLAGIVSMSFHDSSLNDEGLAAITDSGRKPLKLLGQLIAHRCDISDKGVSYLKESPLNYVVIPGTKVVMAESFKGKKIRVFDANVGLIEDIKKNHPEILSPDGGSLTVAERRKVGSRPITPEMASWFPNRHLNFLYHRNVDEQENLETWKQLKKANPIGVSFSFGTGRVATDLGDLKFNSAKYLSFSHVTSCSGSITELLEHLPNLESLNFGYSNLDNSAFAGIKTIADKLKLERIKFSQVSNDFNRSAAQRLADDLPKCNVTWNDELLKPSSSNSSEESKPATKELSQLEVNSGVVFDNLDSLSPQERELNALKWILSHEKAEANIKIKIESGKHVRLKSDSEIPNEPFVISNVVLPNCKFDNSELVVLSGLSSIQSFTAYWSSLNDEGLAALTESGKKPLTRLTKINFLGCPVSKVGLNYLSASPIQSMDILYTGCNEIGDYLKPNGWEWLAANAELVEDILTNRPEILSSSNQLRVGESARDNETFKSIDLELLRAIPDLRDLNLAMESFPSAAIFDELSARSNLRLLGISWGSGNEPVAQHFENGFENLEHLRLSGGLNIDAEQAGKWLSSLPSLKKMHFFNATVSSDAFDSFTNFQLESLILGVAAGGFTEDDAQRVANRNPNCEIILNGQHISPTRSE